MSTETATRPQQQLDEQRMHAFIGKAIDDWGALVSAPLIMIGDRLGLYDALAEAGPLTSAELARRTGTVERYVREWLLNQAASGVLEYDATSGRYALPAEHAAALPALYGGYQGMMAALKAESRIAEAFRSGGGMAWGEHDPALFEGTERFFRVGYEQHLVQEWLPALDGIVQRLQTGGVVADIGCGHGASTIVMARAFPRSTFFGFDGHEGSIDAATRSASRAGVGERTTFAVADATDYPAPPEGYDLIAFFDALHDMPDPQGAARQAHAALRDDGAVLLVEPMAGERVEDNLAPLGRVFAGASTLLCTPHSLSGGGPGLGALATERQLRDVMYAGGFTRFRRATETPFNRVFEARK